MKRVHSPIKKLHYITKFLLLGNMVRYKGELLTAIKEVTYNNGCKSESAIKYCFVDKSPNGDLTYEVANIDINDFLHFIQQISEEEYNELVGVVLSNDLLPEQVNEYNLDNYTQN